MAIADSIAAMIPSLRQAYNASYTNDGSSAYRRRLEERGGMPISFRLAESPVFLPVALRDEMVEASLEIFRQLSTAEALRRSEAAVPPELNVPGSDPLPTFAVTDFAVTREEGGRLAPKLIELQAFPSLYGFQVGSVRGARPHHAGRRADGLVSLGTRRGRVPARGGRGDPLRPARGRGRPPGSRPAARTTAIDFALHEGRLWGVRPRSERDRENRARALVRARRKAQADPPHLQPADLRRARGAGRALPSHHLAHSTSRGGHPNWYFRWSKHCLPQLRHPAVPESVFLSDLGEAPPDLESWVMKPLFSFAGSGVRVEVTPADLATVPEAQRAHTLLMRKVDYAPAIETTDGQLSKVEVRVLFVWKDNSPFPVTTLARLSQGKMMGVNYNKDRTWVGSRGVSGRSRKARSGRCGRPLSDQCVTGADASPPSFGRRAGHQRQTRRW